MLWIPANAQTDKMILILALVYVRRIAVNNGWYRQLDKKYFSNKDFEENLMVLLQQF